MSKKSEIGRLNAAIYRNIQMLLSNKLSDLDIKNGQYDFFYVISLQEGITQKQLSEHLHISKSTTAKAVKNLVSKGYVEKIKDEKDNRMEHLHLTALGKKTAPIVKKIFTEILSITESGLTKTEIEQLMCLMHKVLINVVIENTQLQEEISADE